MNSHNEEVQMNASQTNTVLTRGSKLPKDYHIIHRRRRFLPCMSCVRKILTLPVGLSTPFLILLLVLQFNSSAADANMNMPTRSVRMRAESVYEASQTLLNLTIHFLTFCLPPQSKTQSWNTRDLTKCTSLRTNQTTKGCVRMRFTPKTAKPLELVLTLAV